MGQNQRPNIILIVCDSLGAKHMSLYGYPRRTTPNLERLVGEAGFSVYTRCFTPALWTIPAHASLFTGLYPSECCQPRLSVNQEIITLPEILKSLGYVTLGFSSNMLISDLTGFDTGFDSLQETWRTCNAIAYHEFDFARKLQRTLRTMNGNFRKLWTVLQHTDRHNCRIILKFLVSKLVNKLFSRFRDVRWNSTRFSLKTFSLAQRDLELVSKEGRSCFLFLNIMQTHSEYKPPRQFRGVFEPRRCANLKSMARCRVEHYTHPDSRNSEILEFHRARYDEEVLFLDSLLFRFCEHLKREKQLDNTLLIITSDHGDLFGEMGHVGHGFNTYNSLIHVPLLIKYPGKNSPTVNSSLTQLQDILALVAEIVEYPGPVPDSSISVLSGSRTLALSQCINWIPFAKGLSRRFTDWDIKSWDRVHSNMSLLTPIDGRLFKGTYYANEKWEFFALERGIYEEDNIGVSASPEIAEQLRDTIRHLRTVYAFDKAVSADEVGVEVRGSERR